MKDELNRSYNGGGAVYLLQSELSISTRQYLFSHPSMMSGVSYCRVAIGTECDERDRNDDDKNNLWSGSRDPFTMVVFN